MCVGDNSESRICKLAITIESLKAVPYLKTEHLGDGGAVNLMPLWDRKNWRMWIDTLGGLIEGEMMHTTTPQQGQIRSSTLSS
jgi:hypothetical protein